MHLRVYHKFHTHYPNFVLVFPSAVWVFPLVLPWIDGSCGWHVGGAGGGVGGGGGTGGRADVAWLDFYPRHKHRWRTTSAILNLVPALTSVAR